MLNNDTPEITINPEELKRDKNSLLGGRKPEKTKDQVMEEWAKIRLETPKPTIKYKSDDSK